MDGDISASSYQKSVPPPPITDEEEFEELKDEFQAILGGQNSGVLPLAAASPKPCFPKFKEGSCAREALILTVSTVFGVALYFGWKYCKAVVVTGLLVIVLYGAFVRPIMNGHPTPFHILFMGVKLVVLGVAALLKKLDQMFIVANKFTHRLTGHGPSGNTVTIKAEELDGEKFFFVVVPSNLFGTWYWAHRFTPGEEMEMSAGQDPKKEFEIIFRRDRGRALMRGFAKEGKFKCLAGDVFTVSHNQVVGWKIVQTRGSETIKEGTMPPPLSGEDLAG